MGRRQRSCYSWLHLIRQKLDRCRHRFKLMLGHKRASCLVERAPLSVWERWKTCITSNTWWRHAFQSSSFSRSFTRRVPRSQAHKNKLLDYSWNDGLSWNSEKSLHLSNSDEIGRESSVFPPSEEAMDCRMSMLNSWQATRSLNYSLQTSSTSV